MRENLIGTAKYAHAYINSAVQRVSVGRYHMNRALYSEQLVTLQPSMFRVTSCLQFSPM